MSGGPGEREGGPGEPGLPEEEVAAAGSWGWKPGEGVGNGKGGGWGFPGGPLGVPWGSPGGCDLEQGEGGSRERGSRRVGRHIPAVGWVWGQGTGTPQPGEP